MDNHSNVSEMRSNAVDQPSKRNHKLRSLKSFLNSSARPIALGLVILSVISLSSWLTRKELASTGLRAFLSSKGIPADISIEKLQFDTAQIRDLRLGPSDKPTLTAKNIIIKWHIDPRAGLFVIDRVVIDNITLRVAIGSDGSLDFGALKPFLVPSTGTKRSFISDMTLSNATVLIATPIGPASARVSASGGEAKGWAGRADVTPPLAVMSPQSRGVLEFQPIRLGLAARQARDQVAGEPSKTSVGFLVQFNGQSLKYQGYDASKIVGDLAGQVTIAGDNALRLDMRPAKLGVQRLVSSEIDVGALALAIQPLFWTHNTSWQTNGWGHLVVNGRADTAKVLTTELTTGNVGFRLGIERAPSGRMQLDYQSDIENLSGSINAQRISGAGSAKVQLKNLAKLDKAQVTGEMVMSASGLKVPATMRSWLPANSPESVLQAGLASYSGSASLVFGRDQNTAHVSLVGPVTLLGSSGLRALWLQDQTKSTRLIFAKQDSDDWSTSAETAGRFSVDLAGFGRARGNIAEAKLSADGFAFAGQGLIFKSAVDAKGINTRLEFARLELSADHNGAIKGNSSGQIMLIDGPKSRAQLDFDMSATPAAVTGTLKGPVEGFGLRGGRLNLTGRAYPRGEGWKFDSQANLAARALATDDIAASNPNLTLAGAGQIRNDGQITAEVTATGRSSAPLPPSSPASFALSRTRLDGRANVSGNLNALAVSGQWVATIKHGENKDVRVQDGFNSTRFSGLITSALARFTGSQTTTLGYLNAAYRASNTPTDIAGFTATGPFGVEIALQTPAARKIDGSDLPTSFEVKSNLKLDADRLSVGVTTFRDLQSTGPVSIRGTGDTLQARTVLDLAADKLVTGETALNGLIAKGPITATWDGESQTSFQSGQCLAFSARSGTLPGEGRVGAVTGSLCPDRAGQLAVFSKAAPRVFAITQIAPFTLQLGAGRDGQGGNQSIDIGAVKGVFTSRAGGGSGLDLTAAQFDLRLKMPDGTMALISSNAAELDITTTAPGIALQGRISNISSSGLPVSIAGDARTELTASQKGLFGHFDFDAITVKDSQPIPRFGELALSGHGTISGNQIAVTGDLIAPETKLKVASLTLDHDLARGSGDLSVLSKDLLLAQSPLNGIAGLDVVTLIPSLRGVVSDMTGIINTSANLIWARERPLVSAANIQTKGLDFSTLLGPVKGFAGNIDFDDVLVIRTPQRQTITIGLFDPGLPIVDGVLQFRLPGTNSLQLENASWPFADGKLSVRPATWTFRDGNQAFFIDVEDIDLTKLLRLTQVPNLEIDGKVSGVFPIEVRDGSVEIVGGRLKAREGGGIIRYTGPGASPPAPPPGFFGRIRESLFGKPAPAGADLAVAALRALKYKILEVTVDGRITGELLLGIVLEGSNKQVLSGQPFKFTIKMNVPIGQLLDNLNRFNNMGSSPEVLAEIDRVMREDGAKPDQGKVP